MTRKRKITELLERDLDQAVEEVADTIRYRLVEFPTTGRSVAGLTEELVLDLARHLVGAIEEYGRDGGRDE